VRPDRSCARKPPSAGAPSGPALASRPPLVQGVALRSQAAIRWCREWPCAVSAGSGPALASRHPLVQGVAVRCRCREWPCARKHSASHDTRCTSGCLMHDEGIRKTYPSQWSFCVLHQITHDKRQHPNKLVAASDLREAADKGTYFPCPPHTITPASLGANSRSSLTQLQPTAQQQRAHSMDRNAAVCLTRIKSELFCTLIPSFIFPPEPPYVPSKFYII